MDRKRPVVAFLYAVPIAVLGGLIGLGGAEFRLPVLVGPLRYPAKQAVPLNLAVSFVTLLTALAIRGRTLSLNTLEPFRYGIGAMVAGGVLAAFFGATLTAKVSERQLHRVILALLAAIGCLLFIEGLLPNSLPALLPHERWGHLIAGFGFGLAIGLVSSLLGVAGGELIIPTMVFAFGADIKTAGTASLIISLPTVTVGLIRYASRGALSDRSALLETVVPMGAGSIIGAILGGMLVGAMPASVLKVALGLILNWSAWRIFAKPHPQSPSHDTK